MLMNNRLHVQNCLGAIDGTYVSVRARVEDQLRYRDRKGQVSINVLAAVNRGMEFM